MYYTTQEVVAKTSIMSKTDVTDVTVSSDDEMSTQVFRKKQKKQKKKKKSRGAKREKRVGVKDATKEWNKPKTSKKAERVVEVKEVKEPKEGEDGYDLLRTELSRSASSTKKAVRRSQKITDPQRSKIDQRVAIHKHNRLLNSIEMKLVDQTASELLTFMKKHGYYTGGFEVLTEFNEMMRSKIDTLAGAYIIGVGKYKGLTVTDVWVKPSGESYLRWFVKQHFCPKKLINAVLELTNHSVEVYTPTTTTTTTSTNDTAPVACSDTEDDAEDLPPAEDE